MTRLPQRAPRRASASVRWRAAAVVLATAGVVFAVATSGPQAGPVLFVLHAGRGHGVHVADLVLPAAATLAAARGWTLTRRGRRPASR